jgi:hypothetical protein
MSDLQAGEIPNFKKMSSEELPDEYLLVLKKPITFGKEPNVEHHTELQLREPTLDEIDAFTKNVRKKGEMESLKFFIAAITGVPFVIIGKLGARDMMVAQEYLLAFLRGSQTTGDTSEE